jgi:hypothetical protein
MLALNEGDDKKIEYLLEREYFNWQCKNLYKNLLDWECSINPNKAILYGNLVRIYNELINIKNTKLKAEGELLISNNIGYFINHIIYCYSYISC